MSRYFIDSNICIYALNKSDLAKSEQAIELLKQTSLVLVCNEDATVGVCNASLYHLDI